MLLTVAWLAIVGATAVSADDHEPSRWDSWGDWNPPQGESGVVWLPNGELFATPLADPTRLRYHASYQNWSTPLDTLNAGMVGFGDEWGILRKPDVDRPGEGWQVGLRGGLLALFNLDRTSLDLINADYYFGIPVDWRRGHWSARAQLFHQSSHVGDEFLLDPTPTDFERIELSYEAAELMASWDDGPFRVYGGVRFIWRRDPADLGQTLVQAGWELRQPVGGARYTSWVAGIDLQSWEETDNDIDGSIKGGLEVRSPDNPTRKISFLLEYYDGRAPQGQFYIFDVEYFGFGLEFGF